MSAPLLAWSDRPVDLLRVASCMCTEAYPELDSHPGPRSLHALALDLDFAFRDLSHGLALGLGPADA